jgi:hypothetical protein
MKIRHDEVMVVNGMLTQIGLSFRTKVGQQIHRVAVFQCKCGQKIIVSPSAVRKHQKSCGCESRARIGVVSTTHGNARRGSHTPEFRTWANMKKRCEQESYDNFKYYGGRGISVCERWQSFELFLLDMGKRPESASIDRIDPDGNYEPANCRWASRLEQARNKRNALILTINGTTKRLTEWLAVEGACSAKQVRQRLNRGWGHTEALFGRSK